MIPQAGRSRGSFALDCVEAAAFSVGKGRTVRLFGSKGVNSDVAKRSKRFVAVTDFRAMMAEAVVFVCFFG